MDIDDYINGLIARIDHLEKLTDSLHKEIRTQRKEIGALREERRMILNKDQYPEYDPLGEIP
jgi:uncharacterized coiled-coil DUF342 family protein